VSGILDLFCVSGQVWAFYEVFYTDPETEMKVQKIERKACIRSAQQIFWMGAWKMFRKTTKRMLVYYLH